MGAEFAAEALGPSLGGVIRPILNVAKRWWTQGQNSPFRSRKIGPTKMGSLLGGIALAVLIIVPAGWYLSQHSKILSNPGLRAIVIIGASFMGLTRLILFFLSRRVPFTTLEYSSGPSKVDQVQSGNSPTLYLLSPYDRVLASLWQHGVSVRGGWLLPMTILKILARIVHILAEKNDLRGALYVSGPFSDLWLKLRGSRDPAFSKDRRIKLPLMPYAPMFSWTAAQKSGEFVMKERFGMLEGSWIHFRQLSRGRKVFIISFGAATLILSTGITWMVIGGLIHNAILLIVATLLAMGIGIRSSYRDGGMMRALLKTGEILDTHQPWSLVTLQSMRSPGKEAADSVASALFYQKRLSWAKSKNSGLAQKNQQLEQNVLGSPQERNQLSKWMNPLRLFIFSTRTWVSLAFLAGAVYAVVGPDSALWMWGARSIFLLVAGQSLSGIWMRPGLLAVFTHFYSKFSTRVANLLKNLIAWPTIFAWETQRLSKVAVIILICYAIFSPKNIPHEFKNPMTVGSQVVKEAGEEIRNFRPNDWLFDLGALWKELQLSMQQNLSRTGEAIAPGFNLPRTSENDQLVLPSGAKYAVTPLVAPRDIRHLPSPSAGEPDQTTSTVWTQGYTFSRNSLFGNSENYPTRNPLDPAFPMSKVDEGFTAKYIQIRPTDPDIVAVVLHFNALEAGHVVVQSLFAFEGGAVYPYSIPLDLPVGQSERRVELSPNIETNTLDLYINYAASGLLYSRRPPPRIKVESIDVIRKGRDAVRDHIAPWRPGFTKGQRVEESSLGFTLQSRKLLKLIVHFNGPHPSLMHLSVRLGRNYVELGTYRTQFLDRKLEIDAKQIDFSERAQYTYLELNVDSPGQPVMNSNIAYIEEIFAPPDGGFATLPIMGLLMAFGAGVLKAMSALHLAAAEGISMPSWHAWPVSMALLGIPLAGMFIHQIARKKSMTQQLKFGA